MDWNGLLERHSSIASSTGNLKMYRPCIGKLVMSGAGVKWGGGGGGGGSRGRSEVGG